MTRLTWAAGGAALLALAIAVLRPRAHTAIIRHAEWPEISPDGTQLLFQRTRPSPSGPPASEIYLMGSDGSAERHVATGDQPMWLPDGKRILFTARTGLGTSRPVTRLV